LLIIRVNDPLQISRGIFVYDEIIQMHTIHECSYTVIKLPYNGNNKMKKICKCEKINEKLQFCLLRLSSTTNGMDKPFVD